MNLRHVGYRAYQCVFGLGARLLPWRQPETITGPGSLADIPARLTRYGARRPLVVASRRQRGGQGQRLYRRDLRHERPAGYPNRLHLHPGGGSAADGGVGGQGGQSHLPRAGDL